MSTQRLFIAKLRLLAHKRFVSPGEIASETRSGVPEARKGLSCRFIGSILRVIVSFHPRTLRNGGQGGGTRLNICSGDAITQVGDHKEDSLYVRICYFLGFLIAGTGPPETPNPHLHPFFLKISTSGEPR